MRWFASFFVTLLIALIFAGLLVLRGADIPYLSPALTWAIPFGTLPGRVQLILLFGAYVVVRAVTQRVLAYTESAIDASPRGRSGRRAALGAICYQMFGNPTGRWLVGYSLLLTLLVAAAWPLVALGIVPALGWGLSMLYAITLSAARFTPDKPQPLRSHDEQEVDPVLELEALGAPTPAPST